MTYGEKKKQTTKKNEITHTYIDRKHGVRGNGVVARGEAREYSGQTGIATSNFPGCRRIQVERNGTGTTVEFLSARARSSLIERNQRDIVKRERKMAKLRRGAQRNTVEHRWKTVLFGGLARARAGKTFPAREAFARINFPNASTVIREDAPTSARFRVILSPSPRRSEIDVPIAAAARGQEREF